MRAPLIVVLAVLIAACAPEGPTCASPYALVNGACCLDRDADGTCDQQAENTEAALSCDLCPPKFVTEKEEVIVYRYVCQNGTVVESAEGCGERIVSDADQFTVNKEHDETKILEFDVRPACRGKHRAAELHLVPVKAPLWVTFQVMDDPQTSFRDAYLLNGSNNILDDEYVYVGFCEDCEGLAEISLVPDGAYLVRAVLHYAAEDVVTRDQLLDPTPEGKYGQTRC